MFKDPTTPTKVSQRWQYQQQQFSPFPDLLFEGKNAAFSPIFFTNCTKEKAVKEITPTPFHCRNCWHFEFLKMEMRVVVYVSLYGKRGGVGAFNDKTLACSSHLTSRAIKSRANNMCGIYRIYLHTQVIRERSIFYSILSILYVPYTIYGEK